jgi:putative acetyltransferase
MSFQIRRYCPEDADELWLLFFHTVRMVNIRDYSPEQVAAWAPDDVEQERWRSRLAKNSPFIGLHGDQIVGFADVQENGHIDQFYVHHEWQGRGVGKLLLATIESTARARKLTELTSHVSITARPFFESKGFVVSTAQEVHLGAIAFTNFQMRKPLGLV